MTSDGWRRRLEVIDAVCINTYKKEEEEKKRRERSSFWASRSTTIQTSAFTRLLHPSSLLLLFVCCLLFFCALSTLHTSSITHHPQSRFLSNLPHKKFDFSTLKLKMIHTIIILLLIVPTTILAESLPPQVSFSAKATAIAGQTIPFTVAATRPITRTG